MNSIISYISISSKQSKAKKIKKLKFNSLKLHNYYNKYKLSILKEENASIYQKKLRVCITKKGNKVALKKNKLGKRQVSFMQVVEEKINRNFI